MMKSKDIIDLAIKRHDIDASHFQNTYAKNEKGLLNKRESVFLAGRILVLDELSILLNKLPKGSRILDVGCGTAHLTDWIRQQGFEVYGIEPSNEMYLFAKQNFPEIEIKQAISSSIPYPDNHFDLIVAFEVLRYLDKNENRKTFKEFHRLLKKEKYFFITQVNLYCTDFYYVFHKIKSVYSKLKNTTHHYCNFTTSDAQTKEVKSAGFTEVQTIGRFMGSIRIFYKFGVSIGNFYNSLMKTIFKEQRFINSFYKNLAGHLIIIAKK